MNTSSLAAAIVVVAFALLAINVLDCTQQAELRGHREHLGELEQRVQALEHAADRERRRR